MNRKGTFPITGHAERGLICRDVTSVGHRPTKQDFRVLAEETHMSLELMVVSEGETNSNEGAQKWGTTFHRLSCCP